MLDDKKLHLKKKKKKKKLHLIHKEKKKKNFVMRKLIITFCNNASHILRL